MSNRSTIEQLEKVQRAACYETDIRLFAHLDSILKERAQLCRTHTNDDGFLAMYDRYNEMIGQLINI